MTAAAKPPLFSSDWPRYAKGAHVAFWVISAALATSCLAGWGGFGSARIAIWMFIVWLVAAAVLGGSALCSGRLYVGNQVLARAPLVGWPARTAGGFVVAGAALLLWVVFGLANVRVG